MGRSDKKKRKAEDQPGREGVLMRMMFPLQSGAGVQPSDVVPSGAQRVHSVANSVPTFGQHAARAGTAGVLNVANHANGAILRGAATQRLSGFTATPLERTHDVHWHSAQTARNLHQLPPETSNEPRYDSHIATQRLHRSPVKSHMRASGNPLSTVGSSSSRTKSLARHPYLDARLAYVDPRRPVGLSGPARALLVQLTKNVKSGMRGRPENGGEAELSNSPAAFLMPLAEDIGLRGRPSRTQQRLLAGVRKGTSSRLGGSGRVRTQTTQPLVNAVASGGHAESGSLSLSSQPSSRHAVVPPQHAPLDIVKNPVTGPDNLIGTTAGRKMVAVPSPPSPSYSITSAGSEEIQWIEGPITHHHTRDASTGAKHTEIIDLMSSDGSMDTDDGQHMAEGSTIVALPNVAVELPNPPPFPLEPLTRLKEQYERRRVDLYPSSISPWLRRSFNLPLDPSLPIDVDDYDSIENEKSRTYVYRVLMHLPSQVVGPSVEISVAECILPERMPLAEGRLVLNQWRTLLPSQFHGLHQEARFKYVEIGSRIMKTREIREWVKSTESLGGTVLAIGRWSREAVLTYGCLTRVLGTVHLPMDRTGMIDSAAVEAPFIVALDVTKLADISEGIGPGLAELERLSRAAYMHGTRLQRTNYGDTERALSFRESRAEDTRGDSQVGRVIARKVSRRVRGGLPSKQMTQESVEKLKEWCRNRCMWVAIEPSGISASFRRAGQDPLVPVSEQGHPAASAIESLCAAHHHWQVDELLESSQPDWQMDIDLDECLRFLDDLAYPNPDYGFEAESGIVGPNNFAAALENILLPARPMSAIQAYTDIFSGISSDSGQPINPRYVMLASGMVKPEYAAYAESLVELLLRLGYHSFRHVIRSGVAFHATQETETRPKFKITRASDESFKELPGMIAQQIGGWKSLDFSHFERNYPTLSRGKSVIEIPNDDPTRPPFKEGLPHKDYHLHPFLALVALADHLNTWDQQTQQEDTATASLMVMRLARSTVAKVVNKIFGT